MRIRWIYRSHCARNSVKPATAGNVAEEGKDRDSEQWKKPTVRAFIEFLIMFLLTVGTFFLHSNVCKTSETDANAYLTTRCIEPSYKKYHIVFKIPITLPEPGMIGWTINGSYVYKKYNKKTEVLSQRQTLKKRPAENLITIPWSIDYKNRPTHYTLDADWTLTLPDNSTKSLKQKYYVECDLNHINREMHTTNKSLP